MIPVEVLHERARGCGFRKGGGLYLVAQGMARGCGKLPLVLDVCPTCSAGIKPTRGWTWVDSDALFRERACDNWITEKPWECEPCPLEEGAGRAGLLWIGESFYKTTSAFLAEVQFHGVSRRIPAVPNDFKLGETWVLVAHRKAVTSPGYGQDETEPAIIHQYRPAIFHLFRPERIEYVVKGDEPEKKLEAMVKRGITPVKVVPVVEDELQDKLVKVEEGVEVTVESIRRKVKGSESKTAGYMVEQIPFEIIRTASKEGLVYQVEREVVIFAESAADLLEFFGK